MAIKNKWSFTNPKSTLDISAETELMELLTADIQSQIDATILGNLFVSSGWHSVTIAEPVNSSTLTAWLEQNCKNRWHLDYMRCVFESHDDSVLFYYTWG